MRLNFSFLKMCWTLGGYLLDSPYFCRIKLFCLVNSWYSYWLFVDTASGRTKLFSLFLEDLLIFLILSILFYDLPCLKYSSSFLSFKIIYSLSSKSLNNLSFYLLMLQMLAYIYEIFKLRTLIAFCFYFSI